MSKESQKENNKKVEEFVDNFIDFVSDASDLEANEIDNILQQEGVDISNLINSVQQMVSDALEEDRLSWQKEALVLKESRAKKASAVKKGLLNLTKGELLDRLKSIVQAGEPDFLLAHRNLKSEDLSEDELREIISEYENLGDGE
ncbi:hypothetical protein C4565_09445 [Candidatus Parcubacteria bacterium]|jgi:hypothetical protein|nr:MAG: hypothetical protein C4565_09445 [Candidatus Parcubacteria bacterium]